VPKIIKDEFDGLKISAGWSQKHHSIIHKERNPVTDMVLGKRLQEMRRREHSSSAEQHPESQGFLSRNYRNENTACLLC
jgi:hypothetical protein